MHADINRGAAPIVVIDTRSAQQYDECHIPGAVSFPHRTMITARLAHYAPDTVLVTCCWGPGRNASTRGALRLSALGFSVEEMIGGLEYWRREGLPVEGTLDDQAPLVG